MKFLAILAVIGFICAVSAAPTKEELEARARALEKRLESEITKLRHTHPLVARVLEAQDRELRILSAELEHARLPALIGILEIRLAIIERVVEDELARLEGRTGTPEPPSPRPTGSPSPAPTTGEPSPRPTTGAPSPRPTGSPSPAPTTGAPSPRPTTGAPSPRPTTGAPTGTPAPRPTPTSGPNSTRDY